MHKAEGVGAGNRQALAVCQGYHHFAVRHLEEVDVVGVVLLLLGPEVDDLHVPDPALRAVASGGDLQGQVEQVPLYLRGLPCRDIAQVQPQQARCRTEGRLPGNAHAVDQNQLLLAGV